MNVISSNKRLLSISLSLLVFFLFLGKVKPISAKTDAEAIREQVIEAVEERQKNTHQEEQPTMGEEIELDETVEEVVEHHQEERAPEDKVSWSILGGVIKFQRIDGQWYLSIFAK